MFVEELYEEAHKLGMVKSLRFDIENPHGKLCGVVLFFGQDIFICKEPHDSEHTHSRIQNKSKVPLGTRPEP